MHQECVQPWRRLKLDAAKAGFSIFIVSAFRSFERQKFIWCAKWACERPIMDWIGNHALSAKEFLQKSEEERVTHLLRWSAFPGLGRHHYGTDFDIGVRIPPGEKLQLIPSEWEEGGHQYHFGQWLEEYLLSSSSSWQRPYFNNHSETVVGPEPWHLSYQEIYEDLRDRKGYGNLLRQKLEEESSSIPGYSIICRFFLT